MDKKGKIDNNMYNLITASQYKANPQLYIDDKYIAIEKDNIMYPIQNKICRDTPGYYPNKLMSFFVAPNEDNIEKYTMTEDNVVDFNNIESIRQLIEKSDDLKAMERDILTTCDNKFQPSVKDTDGPEMIILKQATSAKNIDLKKYEQRFEGSYQNDSRLYANSHITIPKMLKIANALDIECLLTMRDKNPDVVNPIGKELTISLNGNGCDIDE